MLLWISCSVFDCPRLSRAEAMLGTPPSYQLLVVGGCQARQPQLFSAVRERNLDRHGEVLEKSPPVKNAEPAFSCNGTSLAGHSDSADKPRFSLTRVCRGQNRTSRPPF